MKDRDLPRHDIINDHCFCPRTIYPLLARPKSRGQVRLASLDPYQKSQVEAGYFTHPDDMKVLIEGMKFALSLTETKAMERLGAKFWDKMPMPGCEQVKPFKSDEYWACVARTYTFGIYHYSGTAKMGPASDPGAVVSHQLKVYGIKGLRVADASILPQLPNANVNAPIIMVGEKAAAMIKEDWLDSDSNNHDVILSNWPRK